MTTLDIKKMPLHEKLETMERLWAALAEEGDDLPSPAWHRPVLAERRRLIASGKAQFIPLAELKKRLER
ncbi:MAG: addiction module protein [Verrucomicrobiota bacterium]